MKYIQEKLREKLIKFLQFIVNRLSRKYVFSMDKNPRYSMYLVGRFTYGEPQILNWGDKATVRFGSFCSIASNVKILLGGNHKVDWITTFPFSFIFDEFSHIQGHPATKGDVVIGNDVWIGMDALILSGVTIGDGAVVAARSVVTRDVKPYSIVAGNPAKLVKMRFDAETIENLLEIKWWDWDIMKIRKNMDLLLSNNIQNFIENHSRS